MLLYVCVCVSGGRRGAVAVRAGAERRARGLWAERGGVRPLRAVLRAGGRVPAVPGGVRGHALPLLGPRAATHQTGAY